MSVQTNNSSRKASTSDGSGSGSCAANERKTTRATSKTSTYEVTNNRLQNTKVRVSPASGPACL